MGAGPLGGYLDYNTFPIWRYVPAGLSDPQAGSEVEDRVCTKYVVWMPTICNYLTWAHFILTYHILILIPFKLRPLLTDTITACGLVILDHIGERPGRFKLWQDT